MPGTITRGLAARAADGATPVKPRDDSPGASGHPGLLSPEGQRTLGTALEELHMQQSPDRSPGNPPSEASPVATLVGGAATAALASDMNALALKEQENSLLYPVKEELTGEQSSAANTGEQRDATEPEGGGEGFGVALQYGLGEDDEDASGNPLSVYEAMVLSPKSMQQHRTVAASPSHSSFSVASGVSSSATSHWDKQDTTKRMMRVPVIDRVMSKVARRISEIPRQKLLGRHQVILLGSGAYNPIHKMHLRMFYIARRYLEERTEYEVLGGLVSPWHATEVRSRYRQRKCAALNSCACVVPINGMAFEPTPARFAHAVSPNPRRPEGDHSAQAPPCHGAVGGRRFDGEEEASIKLPSSLSPTPQQTTVIDAHAPPSSPVDPPLFSLSPSLQTLPVAHGRSVGNHPQEGHGLHVGTGARAGALRSMLP